MKSYDEKVRIIYKILFTVYDLMDIISYPINRSNLIRGLAHQLPNESIKIIDVCCGTGNSSLTMSYKNTNNSIVGIDLLKGMLKIAMKKHIHEKYKKSPQGFLQEDFFC